ncbi:MAG: hypothetical protein CM1200mP10_23620 [Candidatus Neomarinimicrobiota bacterium]|nr:MAG: hypothetical protein CM1200mP10_23620 [Candidatus Neomarinimicrobiota bacterium]
MQQAESKENWINLFGEKTWRGSECMMGIRLMYHERPVGLNYHERPAGCLILLADHFKTVNERDKGILTYLVNIYHRIKDCNDRKIGHGKGLPPKNCKFV